MISFSRKTDPAVKISGITENLEWGEVFLASMDLDEAKARFTAVLAEETDNVMAHFGMGRVFLGFRDSKAAMEHFNTACRLDISLKTQIDPIIKELSDNYLEAAKDRITRNRPGAERFLRDILPGFPDYEEAQILLKKITEAKGPAQ